MWLSNSPWCLMWDAYCNVLTTRPVATKLATGMVGTFLGDMLAQLMQNLLASHSRATARSQGNSIGSTPGSLSPSGAFELDLSRTARLVGFSAMVGTPVAFVWFSLLDQVRNGACYHTKGYTVQARAWSQTMQCNAKGMCKPQCLLLSGYKSALSISVTCQNAEDFLCLHHQHYSNYIARLLETCFQHSSALMQV